MFEQLSFLQVNEILGDFGDDAFLDAGCQLGPQASQRFRRRDDDELTVRLTQMRLAQILGYLFEQLRFCMLMRIGSRLHAPAPVTGSVNRFAWPIGIDHAIGQALGIELAARDNR